jgi:hypothetical protein
LYDTAPPFARLVLKLRGEKVMAKDKKPTNKNTYVRVNKRENPFVQIDKHCFEDENLSWRGKGVLGYLLSRPDDWTICKEDLINRSPDGKTVVEGALTDLMEAGYVYYYAERNEKGQIEQWVYEVYENPDLNPYREECQAKAKAAKEKVKARNKRKNDKRLQKESFQPETDNPKMAESVDNVDKKPETDNPILVEKEPETDNPAVDYPVLDYPLYTNNKFTNKDDDEDIKLKEIIKRDLTSYEKKVVWYAKEYHVPTEEVGAIIILLGGQQYRYDALESAFQETIARKHSGKIDYLPAYFAKTLKQKENQLREEFEQSARLAKVAHNKSLTDTQTKYPFFNWLDNETE